jgi:hypothetical protein
MVSGRFPVVNFSSEFRTTEFQTNEFGTTRSGVGD